MQRVSALVVQIYFDYVIVSLFKSANWAFAFRLLCIEDDLQEAVTKHPGFVGVSYNSIFKSRFSSDYLLLCQIPVLCNLCC